MSKRKLIEVALPLDAINAQSAREKSIRKGHPSTLHLWWARRPLATARAVLFSQLVDDPSERYGEFLEAARAAGAHGARMTGGGFGGSAIALVNADAVHDVAVAVAEAYAREGFNPPAFLDAVPAAPAGRLI